MPLHPELQATLDYLRTRPKHLFTAAHVRDKFRIQHTAACNRLADLHRLGFVTKAYVGSRAWGYGARRTATTACGW